MNQKEITEKKFTICVSASKNKKDVTFVIDNKIFSQNQVCYETAHGLFAVDYDVSIAVKELIIEWDDFQTEVAGAISCEDGLKYRFHRRSEDSNLIRFVKPRGRKICLIKIPQHELNFVDFLSDSFEHVVSDVHSLNNPYDPVAQKRHSLNINENIELKIKPLFGKEILPVQSAHMTVELSVKYSYLK